MSTKGGRGAGAGDRDRTGFKAYSLPGEEEGMEFNKASILEIILFFDLSILKLVLRCRCGSGRWWGSQVSKFGVAVASSWLLNREVAESFLIFHEICLKVHGAQQDKKKKTVYVGLRWIRFNYIKIKCFFFIFYDNPWRFYWLILLQLK